MKTKLAFLTLVTSAVLAFSAEKPPDLTGAVADSFKKHVGKVVTLRGWLEEGKQGPCLWGATPTNVVFYLIPDMPPTGSYGYPASWERLQAIEQLWDAVFREDGGAASPEWHGEVLADRKMRAEKGEVKFLTLPQLRSRLRDSEPCPSSFWKMPLRAWSRAGASVNHGSQELATISSNRSSRC